MDACGAALSFWTIVFDWVCLQFKANKKICFWELSADIASNQCFY